ncbi:helix-turn-helix domain-containing protein [Catellatospora coxensis]|uniref:Transcriptional regulator n=1 Tax=Catellatospora coxensis TaxID=310354 RepID=A0A8J3KS54_9ACTN|nr:helix-turn-helix transcriptional regulator [Catellatospora coxensis]GIG05122.1 transcriptional regulator [Catellatospora coxensis]
MGRREEAGTALGDFLRACRSRVRPDEVGLPEGSRSRRVSGLRREELASLAHLSVDYLVRLEQGRAVRVSPEVLQALSQALRLRPDEHEYLMRVGQVRPTARPAPQRVQPRTRQLLDGWREFPALLLGRRMDVLAWNPLGSALMGDFGALPAGRRNLVRQAFTDPAYRTLYADWAASARECVAYLRMDAARWPDDAALGELVQELSEQDADFRRWWGDHRVRARASGRKRLQHPVAGPMDLEFQSLTVADDPDQVLFVYTAAPGSHTQEALRFLAAWSTGPQEPATGRRHRRAA